MNWCKKHVLGRVIFKLLAPTLSVIVTRLSKKITINKNTVLKDNSKNISK